MRPEDKSKDYKNLRKTIEKHADLKSLAEICVCFANAQEEELVSKASFFKQSQINKSPFNVK